MSEETKEINLPLGIVKFEGYQFEEITYKNIIDDGVFVEETEDGLNIKVEMKEFDENKSILRLTVSFNTGVKKVNVIAKASFNFSEELQPEQKQEVLKTNGVAILFPYVRSAISMITSLDSESALLLPTINFQQLYDNETL